MFAISNRTYGGVGGLTACSEWSICYTRDAAVPSFPSPRHTNLLAKQMHNHVSCLCARPHRCMEPWHAQGADYTLLAGSGTWHDQHLMRELSQMPTCLLPALFNRGISYWYSLLKHWSILRNGNHFISRNWLMFNPLVSLFPFSGHHSASHVLQWNQLCCPFN